jgi:uncharacterized repeat protein (TIGR01451 family)
MLLWALVLAAGCAELRLPAIDPTGRRIFSSTHTTTAVEWPHALAHSDPAFEQPPPIPDCPPAATDQEAVVIAPPAGGHAAPFGQHLLPLDADAAVTLTPTRLVAVVGSEVVLVGGVCGGDGYYRIGEPVEWLLTQESVGTFVQVEPERHSIFPWHGAGRPEKISHNYAVGRTLQQPRQLNRGSADPRDDLSLEAGQTWITISSANEGTSHVMLVAPGVPTWQYRQQTASIHWIDAQWIFPQPAFGTVESPPALATRVTRLTTGQPVPRWLVRYSIAGGAPAGLDDASSQVVERATDLSGHAAVTVVPQGAPAGTTQIQVQLIRPGLAPGDPQRLVVAEAMTSVTWSSASLAVRLTGPSQAEVGQEVTYRAEVANLGTVPADETLLVASLPLGMEWLGSQPPGQVFHPRLQWPLGTLAPNETRVVDMTFQARQAVLAQLCLTAQSGSVSSRQECIETRIVERPVAITIAGPDRAEVNQRVRYLIRITNQSTQPLNNLLIRDQFDPGLQHAQATGSVERDLPALPPGATEEFPIAFTVTQAGQLCHRVQVLDAQGTTLASAESCLSALAAVRRELQLTLPGPSRLQVGAQVTVPVQLTNSSEVPLTNIQLVARYPGDLQLVAASSGAQSAEGQVQWVLPRLDPGQSASLEATFQGLYVTPQACVQLAAQSAEGTQAEAQHCVEVIGAPPVLETSPSGQTPPSGDVSGTEGQPMPEGPPAASPPGMARLDIVWLSRGSPARVGDPVELVLVVQSDRPESDVRITFELPEGLELVRVSGPVGAARQENGTIRMVPLEQVRRDEQLRFLVAVRASRRGPQVAEVRVTSRTVTQPVTRQLTVDVLDP